MSFEAALFLILGIYLSRYSQKHHSKVGALLLQVRIMFITYR